MKTLDSTEYLRKSNEESVNAKSSFDITQLPRAPAKGNFTEAAGALFRQNNIFVSTINDKLHRHNRFYQDDPTFNALEHVPPGHAKYSAQYIDAKNMDDIRDRFFQIEDEIRDRELYADKPLESFFVGFIAANADPTSLFPGTLFYKNYKAQLSAAERAIGVGGSIGLQTTAQEWTLRETQKIRTMEESAENILASTVIGASIGAFAGKFLNSPEGRRATRQTSQVFNNGNITPPGVNPAPSGTPKPKPGGGGNTLINVTDADYPVKENYLPAPVGTKNLPAPTEGPKRTTYATDGLFHGSPKELGNLENIGERQNAGELTSGSVFSVTEQPSTPAPTQTLTQTNTSIYGNGFYTTNNQNVANSYTKKGAAAAKQSGEFSPTVYKIEEKYPVRLKDIDVPFHEDEELKGVVKGIAKTIQRSWLKKAFEKAKKEKTFAEFIDTIRNIGVENQISAQEYQDFLKENILLPLSEKGYRGFTHVGGRLTNSKTKHNVNIYWYPRDDLNIYKFQAGGGNGNVPPTETAQGFAAPEGKSVGAANVMEMALQGQALKMADRTAKAVGTTIAKITPSGRLATNPLGYIRLAGQQIFENNWRYKKNYSLRDEEGQERGFKPNAIALETYIKRDMGKVTSLLMKMDNHYFNQRGITGTFRLEKDYLFGKGLNREEFADAVFRTVHSGIEGENEDVNAAAKLWREFNDEWKDKYTELGVYPEGMTVRNSVNYITHYYNVPWIQDPRNRPQAEQILTDHFKEVNNLVAENLDDIKAYLNAQKKAKRLLKKQTKIEKKYTRLKEKKEKLSLDNIIDVAIDEKIKELEEGLKAGTPEDVKKAIDQATKQFRERMPEEIFDAAWKPRTIVLDDDQIWVSVQNTIDNIMNLNSQRFSNQYLSRMGIGNNPRPTNHRTLLVPTEQIAPMLIRDYRKVLPMFARSMIPNYHITKFAQDMRFDELDADVNVAGAPGQVISGLMSLAREELETRIRGATPEEAKKLYDAFAAGQADIKAGLELLLGTFGNGYNTNDGTFSKFRKVMASYNYTKMMGYMVPAALTDPGAIILRNGYAGLHEGIVSIANHMKSANYNKELLQSIGKSTETYTGYRLKAYADQNDLVGAPGPVTKAFDYLVKSFGNLSLMSPYTDYMQHVATNAYIGDLLRNTVGYAKNIKKLEEMQKLRDEYNANGGVSEFKTSQGSVYKISGKGTQRTKAKREGHNDFGEKTPSEITIYLNEENGREAGMWQTLSSKNKRIVIKENKVILLSKNEKTNELGKDAEFTFSDKPEIGKVPLELWGKDEQGYYKNNHPGNKITEVTQGASAIEKEMAEFRALPDETRSKYLALGLTDEHFEVLYDQWSKFGGVEDEVFWLDWGAWELNTKKRIDVLGDLQAALIKEIDSTIIIPGLGDKPLFAHTDLGNVMLQFKGFGFGSTSKIVMSGLTHNDANFYNGIMAMLFLGAMGYIITSLLKGKEIDTSIENMAFEAIDRSGLLGILMEVPLIAQKMGFLPGMGTSRYQSRDWVGALGGPTLGTLSEWVALANKYKNADETPLNLSDANKTWRQVPLNNLWWLDGLNRNMGITDSIALSLGFEDNR